MSGRTIRGGWLRGVCRGGGGGVQICLTKAEFFLGWGRGWGVVVRTFFWVQVYSKTLKFWRVCPYPITPSNSCRICYWTLLPVQEFLEIYNFFAWCHYGPWGLWFFIETFVFLTIKKFNFFVGDAVFKLYSKALRYLKTRILEHCTWYHFWPKV